MSTGTGADPVVRAASAVAGGPDGAHLAPGRWGPVPLLVLGSTASVALAVLAQQHCRATGWASPDQFTHACYSDVPALVATGGAAGQPPGTALVLSALAAVTSTPLGAFDLAAVLLAAVLAVGVACLARVAARPGTAALLALSPVLVTASLVSLDLVAATALAAAMLAWSRRHPASAGALVALAASVRPVAGLVAGALVLDAVRARRARETGPLLAAAVAATAAVGLLARLVPGTQGATWAAGLDAGAGYGSLWLLPSLAGRPLPPGAVPVLAVIGLAVVVAGAVALALRGRRPASPAATALLLVAGALVLSPSVPVQATLVVLPLAALAVPRWSAHLPWAAAEVAYAVGTWLYLYGTSTPDRALPAWAYGALLVLRLAALASLVVRALRVPVQQGPEPAWGRAEREAPRSR